MNETTWLATTRPMPLLNFLGDRATERKRRLFAVACCRRIWHLLGDGCLRAAVEAGEEFADNPHSEDALAPLRRQVDSLANEQNHACFPACCVKWSISEHKGVNGFTAAAYAAEGLAFRVAGQSWTKAYVKVMEQEYKVLMGLLRDVFGNPFRPVAADPLWLTSTVVELARGIYAERAIDRLPILADALQDAGCENVDVLGHCRGPGPHGRGCWVVDLLLGKD